MAIYRTRPEFVEAVLLTPHTAHKIATWCNGVVAEDLSGVIGVDVPIGALGLMRALLGMYVVRDAKSQWQIMTHNDFVGKYELL